ncbi:uncharacterized protein B0T15DRAFT_545434 [Chaetomium strumarium]|uniref:Uncharacterized protein n=1 Tax=Chaetomium strumarium TaxID=1170767 RepID=A0AAJ0M595_9PEZI|nr:hypothetical protein B0T15DRAFT_545434 [Chaetomium strumarium]
MSRRKKDNSQAKNADSDPASPLGERQPLHFQSQQPNPRRAKKTVAKQRHQGQDKTSGIRVVKLTAGSDEDLNNTKAQTSQKRPQRHQRRMARNGRHTNGPSQNPGPRRQTQLELPDWVPPKNQAKNFRRKNRSNGAAKNEQAPPPKPWEMDDIFPEPVGNPCTFEYDRTWRSLEKVDGGAKETIQKYLTRGRRQQLPRIFPDSNLSEDSEEMRKVQQKYWKAGQPELLKIRRGNVNAPGAKLFIASSIVDDSLAEFARLEAERGIKEDENAFFKVMRVAELRRMIIDLLLPSIGDITALAATCKGAAIQMRNAFDYWDFNAPLPEIESNDGKPGAEEKKRKQERAAIDRLVQAKTVSDVPLVISPISSELRDPENPYAFEFRSLRWIFCAITEIPSSVRTVIVDQIPFFNVRLFEMMVNSMPNLETVIITRCPLLDVTKLKPLLDVVERHPRAGPANAPKYIRLDFSPFFFEGPNSCNRLGSYGVTWHEPTFNIPKAVFALILRCWDLARKVGMDLLSESSSFWSFVRRLPGPDVLWAVKAREALITREHELAAHKKSENTIKANFAHDLAAALVGDNHPHPQRPSRMAARLPGRGRTYWLDYIECGMCKLIYPAGVFPLRNDGCWGCKMARFVETMEDSHMRFWQDGVTTCWLWGFTPASSTLEQLLFSSKPSNVAQAETQVWSMDWTWKYWLKYFKPMTVGGWPDEPFCPPLPNVTKYEAAALSRWRFKKHPVPGPFDWRKGGPQHEHPCKVPLSGSNLEEGFGSESKANFARHWQWTSRTDKLFTENWLAKNGPAKNRSARQREQDLRKALEKARTTESMKAAYLSAEWHERNEADKQVHRWTQPRVEDCIYSLGTPDKRPFNLDKPALDPVRDREEYKKAMEAEMFRSGPYTFASAVNTSW